MKSHILFSTIRFEKHRIPQVIVPGARPGPTLVVIGLQHAGEFSGPAAVDRVLDNLDTSRLAGTLVCLPIVNPIQMHFTEEQFRASWSKPDTNLNRQWPGVPSSRNPLSRLAALIWDSVLLQADAVIDYHCCRTVDPRFAACLDGHKPSEALAAAMRLEAVDLQDARSYAEGPLIFPAAEKLDIPSVLVESHPSNFQVREAVDSCEASLMRAMVHLGMLGSWNPPRVKAGPVPLFRRSEPSHALKATRPGYLGIRKWAGQPVRKGEIIAEIRSLDTFEVTESFRSPVTGAIGSAGVGVKEALVKPGSVVATVKRVKWA